MNDDLQHAAGDRSAPPDPDPSATVTPGGTPPIPPEPAAEAAPAATAPEATAPEATAPATRAPATTAPSAAPPSAVRAQNRIAIVGTLALVIALVAGGAFLLGRGTGGDDRPSFAVVATATLAPTGAASADPSASSSAPATASSSPAPATPVASDPYTGIAADGNRLGSADARLEIEYWADYQCPFCGKFAQETIPDLLPFLRDGSVALVHRDFAFLGPESFDAAVAVRCADREGRYWAMHDAVYAAQDGENQGAFARDRLVAIGAGIGLDGGALEACIADRSVLVEVLDDTSAGVRSAIQSTPTIDVNGTRFLGVPDPAELRAAIEGALAGASPEPLPTQAPIDDPWAALPVDGRSAGDAAAPITVDLWMDYQSTDGQVVATELGEGLRSRIADGSIRLVLHDLAVLGEESELAAAAVRCVDAQGGPAWLVHEVLAVNARGAGSGIYTADALLRFMTQLGLDIVAADACLGDAATLAAIEAETADGRALGLEAAPAIVVSAGGEETARFTGTLDATAVLAAIDEAK